MRGSQSFIQSVAVARFTRQSCLNASPSVRGGLNRLGIDRLVRRTDVHEVGHHFGIDDVRLHELGW
ncbi:MULTISPECIES: metallopeptidase family protein [unclassified Rhodococcus (in: high G+C Gram-positive bacteria)]|uniref:metallopeptidase family protein n=1 Tax=unclassified Rhodococcus (in: high G+C Gram-positive bacteria) TaxID=192944 RepID=UPI00211C60F5|nr:MULTISPECIES: metallopeptidase family protein [unclassified Rhodococcus (in: high G+C Gram-positive bacteria)]